MMFLLIRLVRAIQWGIALKIGAKYRRWRKQGMDPKSLGDALAQWFEQLGPVFVKMGQALSVHRDLLPKAMADALAKLRDDVKPFSSADARLLIEQALGQPIDDVFEHFEDEPMAAASIAQVHGAVLQGGQKVVVKVLRPNIRQRVIADVRVLRMVSRMLDGWVGICRQLQLSNVVDELALSFHDELDLTQEAASASALARNFAKDERLAIPSIHWPYAVRSVLVQERITGVSIDDIDALDRAGVDKCALASNLVELFFIQLFRDRFFHADLHPGNVFVDVRDPKAPRLVLVDFGIMGALSHTDQYYLAENFIAFFKRDYARVTELHLNSGWIPSNTRPDRFEMAMRMVGEPMFDKALKDISCADLLMRLFQTAQKFNMKLQPQLVLLQKTLFAVEGLSREIYPDLDLWQVIEPYMQTWLKEQQGIKSKLNRLKQHGPNALASLPELPGLLQTYLERSIYAHRRLDEPARGRGVSKVWQYFAFGAFSGIMIFACSIYLMS